MDFKKITDSAGTFFNRAKQFTEEKLGQSQITAYDIELEELISNAEKTKVWSERILLDAGNLVEPSLSTKLEEKLFTMVNAEKPVRLNAHETIGVTMLEAAQPFGADTEYGLLLKKCGEAQQKIGEAQREFSRQATNCLINPLKTFLETDYKTIEKEKAALDLKRLDLDARKSAVRRSSSVSERANCEAEEHAAQMQFDRQAEVLRLLLKGINSTHLYHRGRLLEFMQAQEQFYSKSAQLLADANH